VGRWQKHMQMDEANTDERCDRAICRSRERCATTYSGRSTTPRPTCCQSTPHRWVHSRSPPRTVGYTCRSTSKVRRHARDPGTGGASMLCKMRRKVGSESTLNHLPQRVSEFGGRKDQSHRIALHNGTVEKRPAVRRDQMRRGRRATSTLAKDGHLGERERERERRSRENKNCGLRSKIRVQLHPLPMPALTHNNNTPCCCLHQRRRCCRAPTAWPGVGRGNHCWPGRCRSTGSRKH
jgi:hypothetical protein